MDTSQLRLLYEQNHVVQIICDHMADRRRNQAETKLKRILGLLLREGHSVKRPEAIAAFRELENVGCGEYVEGRHGWPSRFVWSVGSLSACKTAQGEDIEIETVEDDDAESSSDVLVHTFHLRPDYDVDITLPVDLTANEAARLAKFLDSLPMEEYDWDR